MFWEWNVPEAVDCTIRLPFFVTMTWSLEKVAVQLSSQRLPMEMRDPVERF